MDDHGVLGIIYYRTFSYGSFPRVIVTIGSIEWCSVLRQLSKGQGKGHLWDIVGCNKGSAATCARKVAIPPPSEAESFPKPRILTVAAVEPMTAGAQGNQVGVSTRTLLTALLFVMHLQALARAANLTPPPVPLHHLLAELFIRAGI